MERTAKIKNWMKKFPIFFLCRKGEILFGGNKCSKFIFNFHLKVPIGPHYTFHKFNRQTFSCRTKSEIHSILFRILLCRSFFYLYNSLMALWLATYGGWYVVALSTVHAKCDALYYIASLCLTYKIHSIQCQK